MREWYKTALRRNVVDMHIPDWNDKFLSEFDPEKYVEMLKLAKVQSAVLYAHSHAGACFYPTIAGHMHKNLKGRDIFGETLKLCHKNNIKVVAYYSLIHDTWAHLAHPEFRMVKAKGEALLVGGRYGMCCPNSPYRDYVVAQIKELCEYDFDGIRFDMTFWSGVCYCRYCGERFVNEVGSELPTKVNWDDSRWVTFQREREEWLNEFAHLATSTVKELKPDASVEHQISTLMTPWKHGVTVDLRDECDFLQGDFYGGKLQGSFVNKLLYNLTPNRPHGFETSANIGLGEQTTLKSKELLKAKAYCALANGGAFIFIDALDPVGTLNPMVYRRMRDVFDETSVFEKYFGGEMHQDVAIFYSTESKFDPGENGEDVQNIDSWNCSKPHLDSTVGAAQAFIYGNMLFGVITRKNLDDLLKYQVVVLPNVLMMDEKEVEAVRNYVREGGSLYASKYTSLITKDGKRHEDFLLADVFGVSYVGETKEGFTYIAPTAKGKSFLSGCSEKYPLSNPDVQTVVKAHDGAEVLATTVLPYTVRGEERFASIHSDPPGISTGSPAIVRNGYGKGMCIYNTGNTEKFKQYDKHGEIFAGIIRSLLKQPLTVESDAPKPVEITVFHQDDKKRYIINMLNFQEELPNIPVQRFRVKVHLGERKIKQLIQLPGENPVPFEIENSFVKFSAPQIETFTMLALDYE
jgi:hypothetical protein